MADNKKSLSYKFQKNPFMFVLLIIVIAVALFGIVNLVPVIKENIKGSDTETTTAAVEETVGATEEDKSIPLNNVKNYIDTITSVKAEKLTTAPALPATTLVEDCYYGMFQNCKNINYIKMLATDISADNCLNIWVYDVSSTGTFVKNPNMTSLPTGVSGIPSGWTVINNGED